MISFSVVANVLVECPNVPQLQATSFVRTPPDGGPVGVDGATLTRGDVMTDAWSKCNFSFLFVNLSIFLLLNFVNFRKTGDH